MCEREKKIGRFPSWDPCVNGKAGRLGASEARFGRCLSYLVDILRAQLAGEKGVSPTAARARQPGAKEGRARAERRRNTYLGHIHRRFVPKHRCALSSSESRNPARNRASEPIMASWHQPHRTDGTRQRRSRHTYRGVSPRRAHRRPGFPAHSTPARSCAFRSCTLWRAPGRRITRPIPSALRSNYELSVNYVRVRLRYNLNIATTIMGHFKGFLGVHLPDPD